VAAVSWWLWVLIWLALGLGALFVLFLLLRTVWRKLKLLFAELNTATERLAAVTEELERLQERTSSAEPPAVFENPAELRARRFATRTKHRPSRRRTQT
jgi:uncharacterized protein HemX